MRKNNTRQNKIKHLWLMNTNDVAPSLFGTNNLISPIFTEICQTQKFDYRLSSSQSRRICFSSMVEVPFLDWRFWTHMGQIHGHRSVQDAYLENTQPHTVEQIPNSGVLITKHHPAISSGDQRLSKKNLMKLPTSFYHQYYPLIVTGT